VRGSVRKRGKVWAYAIDVGVDPATGKRKQHRRSGFKTERAAAEAMREALSEVRAGTFTAGRLPSLATYVRQEWLPGRRHAVRPSTWASYRDVLEGRVLPRIGELRLDQMKPGHVADLYADLLKSGGRDERRTAGLSPRTVRYTGMVLKRVLSDALKRGLIVRNPAEHVERPKVRDAEMSWWSITEARAFLAHIEGDRLAALWKLYLTTGLRRGEALGLKWDDIDLDAARLAVRRTLVAVEGAAAWSEPKTAASRRVVTLDPATVEVLRAHRRRQLEERLALGAGYRDQGIVFATVVGEAMHPDSASKMFDRLIAAAGVRRIRLHDLRHTAATVMLEQGVPLKVVTERLGHSSTRITADLYQHAGETMQADAAAKLGAVFLAMGPGGLQRG
jgi:integrase